MPDDLDVILLISALPKTPPMIDLLFSGLFYYFSSSINELSLDNPITGVVKLAYFCEFVLGVVYSGSINTLFSNLPSLMLPSGNVILPLPCCMPLRQSPW